MKQLTVIAPVKVIKVYHHDGEVSPFEEFFRLVFEAENLTPPIDLTSKMVKGGSRRGFVSSFCVLVLKNFSTVLSWIQSVLKQNNWEKSWDEKIRYKMYLLISGIEVNSTLKMCQLISLIFIIKTEIGCNLYYACHHINVKGSKFKSLIKLHVVNDNCFQNFARIRIIG